MTEPKWVTEIKDEPTDIKFADDLFKELGEKTAEELMERFEKKFYLCACASVELYEKICLHSSNNKLRAEGAKYFMNLFRDQNLTKNILLIRELRAKVQKVTTEKDPPDAKATWKKEPETDKK